MKNSLLNITLLSILLAGVMTATHAQAPLRTWDGGGGNSLWSSAANWNPNVVPVAGDSVVLDHRHVSGDYSVDLPNTAVTVRCLRVYPSHLNDSIFVNIPTTNTVATNLRVTGLGYHALSIGNRGRFNNMSGAAFNTDAFRIDGIANHGMLLDTGGYYYHSTISRDTVPLRNLATRLNSTFEYDKPSGFYTVMIFPINSPVGSITFHHLIMSGRRSGGIAYGGTLANNWDLIINGDLTVRDNASFGVVRGATGQNRTVYFRGNITSSNTTQSLWFEASAAMSFGWYVVFDGTTTQTITGDLVLLDRTTINNPAGLVVNNLLEIKPAGFAAVDPSLVLTNGIVTTQGPGEVYVSVDIPGKVLGHPSRTDSASTAPSYINGVLRRAVQSSGIYEFPIGTATNYELCVVNFTGMAGVDDLSASFLTTGLGTIPLALPEGGFGYNQLLNRGYWRLTPNAAMTAGSYALSLYETGYTNGGANNFRVVKRTHSAAPWTFQGSHLSQREKPAVVVASRGNLNAFSEFAIAFPPGTLPLELEYFAATLIDDEVQLAWAIADIAPNVRFTLEHSPDGQVWEPLPCVIEEVASQREPSYQAWDDAPYPGTNHYRLVILHPDGTTQLSAVRTVLRGNGTPELGLYPNPTSDILHVAGINADMDTWRLYNAWGNQVQFQGHRLDKSHASLGLGTLPPGHYYLRAGTSTYRFLKY